MDIVKIDKAFIDRLTIDAAGRAMVRAVVELSRALGLSTIAEGVEHAGQLSVLRELGCSGAQGYLIARPMPVGAFADFASSRRDPALRSVS